MRSGETNKYGVINLDKTSIVIKFYWIERWFWTHKMRFLAKVYWRLIYILFACQIPPTVELEEGVNIAHGVGIVIHQDSVVGSGTMIYQNVTLGSGGGPVIGRNCILGAGCCILGSIHIGDNVKVGANAVVLQDIPDNCTVVGVPARIVKINGIKVKKEETDNAKNK